MQMCELSVSYQGNDAPPGATVEGLLLAKTTMADASTVARDPSWRRWGMP
jgi:hypothetical protein